MYFKRKIDAKLDEWLRKKDSSPALVVGIRQCGKTETIHEFAKRNGMQLIEINFWTHPEYCSDFEGGLDIVTLVQSFFAFPKCFF